MRRLNLFLLVIGMTLVFVTTHAQAPKSFRYQSIARNAGGVPIAGSTIGLRISIRDLSETGTILYRETHSVTTNEFGLFSLSIGEGTVVSGSFATIAWGTGAKFIEVEADFSGGTSYTSLGATKLLSVPYALYSENGTPGPQGAPGPQGPTGPAGPQGVQGSSGPAGPNGLSVLSGSVDPTGGIGVNGEFYINTSSNMLFGPKAGGSWPIGVSLIGAAGPQGVAGTDGTNGLNVLNGLADPTGGDGLDGEFYINTSTNTLFGPKAGGSWPPGFSLVGPQGLAGPAGPNGLNVLNGTVDPAGGTGADGEFYINTSTSMLFGPKAGGAWPSGVSLVGLTGPAGTNGLNVLNGTVNPSAGTGVNGEFYINTTTKFLFGPKAGGVWGAGVSLVGMAGPKGLGVLNGTTDPGAGTGMDGEFYINTSTDMLFGPKASGVWPAGVSLVGMAGAAGTNGLNVLNGTVDPVAGTGVNGEFYINTTTKYLFGPKSGGAWPSGVSLAGPNGPIGPKGLGVLNGTTDPGSGTGMDGEFYINTSTDMLFGPKASGVWPAGVSLVGMAGPQGVPGLLSPGSSPGNTPYWDGSNWVTDDSNIYNNGGNVGIGTTTPGAKLDVAGSLKITDGSEGLGKVLTSDAAGLASWVTPSGGSVGGSGALNYIPKFTPNGTTLGSSLLYENGTGVGIGTTNPLRKLHIDQVGGGIVFEIGNAAANNNFGQKFTNSGGGAELLILPGGDFTIGRSGFAESIRIKQSNSDLILGSTFWNVGVGTTNPTAKLDVTGTVKIADGTQGLGKVLTSDANGLASWQTPAGGSSGWGLTGNAGTVDGTNFIGTTDNTALNFKVNNQKAGRIDPSGSLFMGQLAGNNNTVSQTVTGIGFSTLSANQGYQNTAVGWQTLTFNTTGGYNSGVGDNVLTLNTTGSQNTAQGSNALHNNLTGSFNTAIGVEALFINTGSNNTATGTRTLRANTTGGLNTANGMEALLNNSTGSNNVAVGSNSLYTNTTGGNNTATGYGALSTNATGNNNTAIGYFANVASGNLSNATVIGYNAVVNASNTIQLGNSSVTDVFAGTGTNATLRAGGLQITGGSPGVGKVLTSDATGIATWQTAGGGSGWGLSGNAGTDQFSNFIGTTDDQALTIKVNNSKAGWLDQTNNNVSFGYQALNTYTNGLDNTALGASALYSANNSTGNTAVGSAALWGNTTGSYNTVVGNGAMPANTTGQENTAGGVNALSGNTTGSYNTSFGRNALNANTTGNNNTALGYGANVSTGALTNATAIGNGAIVNASNTVQLGNSSVTDVYAGTGTSATLRAGGLQITGGSPGVGKVLTSDATGVATWQAAGGGSGWGLTGNAGTVDGTNFIGTTDNVPLSFRVNNEKSGRIEANGAVLLGFQAGLTSSASITTGIGTKALFSNTSGNANTAVGFQSMYFNTTGGGNSAFGTYSLPNNTTGVNNTAIGYQALINNLDGTSNTAVGFNALNGNAGGSANTAVGLQTLQANTTGQFNTAIGSQANVGSGNLTNATAIGNGAIVNASNTIQLGNASVTQILAGTSNNATVVAGGLKITGGSPGVGKVLTSDATGVATWQAAGAGSGWGLTGNAGTVAGTSFIGTTDDVPFEIRVNNLKAGRIESDTYAGSNLGNTFFGYLSGFSNTTGTNNLATGFYSLYSNTSGSTNTATGGGALYSNTTGNYNTATGANAQQINHTGSNNTSYGMQALQSNWAGNNGTAIGTNAMQYANSSLSSFTNYNVAVGFEALRGPTNSVLNTGNQNTAVGYQTLFNNTTGGNNIGIGAFSLYENTTGSLNTAINGALFSNTSGNNNVAIGPNAMINSVTGNNNVALGFDALNSSNGGSNNVALGYGSLFSNGTGSNNTAVGYGADVSGFFTNATAIGNGAIVNASNKVRIGNASVTVVESPVAVTVASDRRLKENIKDSDLGLDFILQIHPVQYNMINGNGRTDYGFIAQELKVALGDRSVNMLNKDGEYYHVRYNDLIAPIVKAMQEQQALIVQLKAEIDRLQASLADKDKESASSLSSLEERISKLEVMLNASAQK